MSNWVIPVSILETLGWLPADLTAANKPNSSAAVIKTKSALSTQDTPHRASGTDTYVCSTGALDTHYMATKPSM